MLTFIFIYILAQIGGNNKGISSLMNRFHSTPNLSGGNSAKQAIYLDDRPVVNWAAQLRYDLYVENAYPKKDKAITEVVQKLIQSGEEESVDKLFGGKGYRQSTYNIKQDPLPQFPHGYYCSYISIQNSIQFNDELTWYIPYFKYLEQKNQNQKIVDYNQISSTLNDMDADFERQKVKPEIKQEKLFTYLKYLSRKYICPLDSVQRMEIYLEVLKTGSCQIDKYYKQFELKCLWNVFKTSILGCQKYFRKHNNILNLNTKSISVAYKESVNEVTVAKTPKMLFCPICCLYDCGIHSDDKAAYKYSHHFVSSSSDLDRSSSVASALQLFNEYCMKLSIKQPQDVKMEHEGGFNCSDSCYKRLRNESELIALRKRIAKTVQLTNVARASIDIGIYMFNYHPCMLWPLVQKKVHAAISCQMVFMYLIQSYNIMKVVSLKMYKNELICLRNVKEIEQDTKQTHLMHRKHKNVSKDIYHNNKVPICHHHFLNNPSIDQGCSKCQCQKRGYCRRECLCSSNCPLKRGCSCKVGDCGGNKCFCSANSRECQPGICPSCFSFNGTVKLNKCKNHSVMDNDVCLLRIGKSLIPKAGLGLFAGHNIKKGQLVSIYTGQIIDHNLQTIRQNLRISNDFYNFGNHGGVIDSRFLGNKTRFINHGNEGEVNLTTELKMCNGTHMILFFASKDISAGQEVKFDYDANGQIYTHLRHKYPFIKKKK